jgi:hypothetical protein
MYISQQNVYPTILPQQALGAVRHPGVHVGDRERGALGPGGHVIPVQRRDEVAAAVSRARRPGPPNSALTSRKASSRKFRARLMNAGSNPIEELTAVTAVSATNLWASGWVGNIDNENKLEPIILHSTGGAWSRVTAPNSASEGSRLNGITSDGADAVFAVGTTQDSNGSLLTLIEQFNGSSWKAIPSPDPGKQGSLTDNVLTAAGSAAGDIWAVGAFNKQGDCCDLPLAQAQNMRVTAGPGMGTMPPCSLTTGRFSDSG